MLSSLKEILPATQKQKQAIGRMLGDKGLDSKGVLEAEMTSGDAKRFMWALREADGIKKQILRDKKGLDDGRVFSGTRDGI